MRISDWSSDVCSSDLLLELGRQILLHEIDRRLGMRQHSGQPSGPAAGEPRETAFHLAERLAALRFGVGLDEVGQPLDGGEIAPPIDRKSVVKGKSVSVRVDFGGRLLIHKKNIT